MAKPGQIRLHRVAFVAMHDLLMATAAFEIAVWTRYEILGAPQGLFFLWTGTLAFVVVCSWTFWWCGLYRGIWHYASLTDLITILRASSISILLFLPIMFITTRLDAFPRSALFLLWPLLILLLAIPRLCYRILKDRDLRNILERSDQDHVPVLMVGAGNEADRFIREVNRPGLSPYKVVGIVDNKSNRIGRDIRGVRIWGNLDSLNNIIEKLNDRGLKPQRLIISTEQLSSEQVQKLLKDAGSLGMSIARLPRVTDFRKTEDQTKSQIITAGTIQPIAMEDLLKRPQKVLDEISVRRLIEKKRVLVTGAGGTIGSELVRQVVDLNPESICLLDNSEFALYKIDTETSELAPHLKHLAMLSDIRDYNSICRVFQDYKPELVLHAAALKHVPLSEKNPMEAILTNVMGTRNVAKACQIYSTQVMVLISTDKAVYPSSIMGVTKRLAETYCQALSAASRTSQEKSQSTRFVVVRFGNVLGSTGSVVPLFQRQIALGGPVTVTHPEATRYFMTTREAVRLVLQASCLPEDRDNPERIFVLDMGEPVKIQNLARQLIRMAGLRPDKDVLITFTGLRPGEKIHEELFYKDEILMKTNIPSIKQASPHMPDLAILESNFNRLKVSAEAGEIEKALIIIKDLVNEYEDSSSMKKESLHT